MTQRIFDIKNEKDMADLWDILPDDVKRIKKNKPNTECVYVYSDLANFMTKMLKINWHDKTEITRPIQEATEQDIGKLCVFYDDINNGVSYGILKKIRTDRDDFNCFKFNRLYKHCRRLTKQEIEELC